MRLVILLTAAWAGPAAAADKPDVLFIPVDDLNHWVGHLGRNPQTKTPNLDRLAKMGVSFTRAYCTAPACNPSRASLMSGLRPSTTGVYHNPSKWEDGVIKEPMLTTHFRRAGYRAVGAGKIYHGGPGRMSEWDEYYKPGPDLLKPVRKASKRGGVGGIRFAPLDAGDDAVKDYHDVTYCIEQLAKKDNKPLFLACGLFRPHMPWNVPRKYYDMFPLGSIRLPPHTAGDLSDVPQAGIKVAKPNGDHAKMLKSGRWKEAIQAYLAAIAYTDMNLGRLLDAVEKSPRRDNLIIVLWGDHGWHLGEKQHWRKFALWEEATRAPLIWVAPGVAKPGTECDTPVDFSNVYPTLCDLCGVKPPAHLEGVSLRPLMENPDAEWGRPAVTTHGFGNHAVRTRRYRYIRYGGGGEELYDHKSDRYEWENIAGKPGSKAVIERLARALPKVNKPAGPKRKKGNKRRRRKSKK